MHTFLSKLRALFTRSHSSEEEFEIHLTLLAERFIAQGMVPEEAALAARRQFGNAGLHQQKLRDQNRFLLLSHLWRDLRYSIRGMLRNPGFALTAIFTLALGMGANVAVFALMDAVLLRSLPVANPQRLYFVNYAGATGRGIAPPYPFLQRMQREAHSLESVAAYSGQAQLKIRPESSADFETANGARVSGNYYEVLGLQAALGRLLTAQDELLNPAVAVLSYDYWQTRYAGSLAALGSSFTLDGTSFTIVGVAPKGFSGLQPGHRDDITIPITTMNLGPHDGAGMLADHNSPWFQAIGRLTPGVSPAKAQSEIDTLFQSYMTEFPVSAEARRDQFNHIELVSAAQGLGDLRKQFAHPLQALMAVVALVLLVACANITNLLLARATRREREFAVRIALGAGHRRLLRQFLTETALLFFIGAAASLAVAFAVVRLLLRFFATGPQHIQISLHFDAPLLVFALALPLLATLVFGAAPILHVLRTDPHAAMKEGSRMSESGSKMGFGRALIVLQIALSLILLVGASLFLRTLHNLHSIDPGFSPSQVALMQINLLESAYPESPARLAAWDRILSVVRVTPGVQSAALSAATPFDTSGRHAGFIVPGYRWTSDADSLINLDHVSEDYFKTLNTPVLRGRDLSSSDVDSAPHVALLNQTAARHYFPRRDPIGVEVHINDAAYRIAGVVQDIHQSDLREPATPFIFLPVRQPYDRNFRLTLLVRTTLNPTALAATLARQIHAVARDSLVKQPITLSEQMDESIVNERLVSTLVGIFGLLALMLSAVGLYGVIAYTVARRTPEFAVRLAIGALPQQVIGSVLLGTLRLLGIGLVIGVPSSILLARAADSLFYGVTPTDLSAQLVASTVLSAVALIASVLPAIRISKIDPTSALRTE
jgi:predicted permease